MSTTQQRYHLSKIIGKGSYGLVLESLDKNTGQCVAVKKSRVSQKVSRPVLRYESRILQLLQGHPAIPVLHGYGQLPHFEYMSMDLLGPSINTDGPISIKTAVRVVLQMLSVLKHIHSCGIVHRDIKPANVLCSRTDASRIILIDYNIAIPIKPGPPAKYDPLGELRHTVGTLDWASLNAHDGIDLAPRDDIESLAYMAFFLLRGSLPWKIPGFRHEKEMNSMRRIHASKAAASGDSLGAAFPAEFGCMLDRSRSLQYHEFPDYEELQRRFFELDAQLGNNDPKAALDWSPVGVAEKTDDMEYATDGEDTEGDSSKENVTIVSGYSMPSYLDAIIDWDIQDARDTCLTLPAETTELLSESIAQITEVTGKTEGGDDCVVHMPV
ncbi:kinase-like protein [Pholiota conissans]|uniref:non-specific serine/threonine protein kinase n=1 Tax=Pholiota conissans TaxID=109636 RepID=A0A9P6D7P2_9AGAR|nr:kinase-like protein [Pholiota conissans]